MKKMLKKGGRKRKNSEMTEKEVVEILPPAKIFRQNSDADAYVKKVSAILGVFLPFN